MLSPGPKYSALLEDVDRMISDTLRTATAELQAMVDHLLARGGKKLRPLLVFAAADLPGTNACAETGEALLKTAAAVELIHTASLVHDDVIDNAARRRGMETLHCRWDSRAAVLAGDYLLSRAFDLLSTLEQRKTLLPLMSRSVSLMCHGETLQQGKRYDWRTTEHDYLRFNFLKTSQFLAACCEAGGIIGAASPGQLRALREYGCNLGQAFQIVDDILDYAAEPHRLGKPVGGDLGQGVVTLPLIYLLRSRKREPALLRSVLSRRGSLGAVFEARLREAVKRSGALNTAARKAERCIEAARQALKSFPPVPARHLLERLAGAGTGQLSAVQGNP